MRRINFATILAVMGLFSVQSSSIAATFTPVNLDDIANLRIQTKNASYPEGEFLTRFAVPFDIALGGNNAWGSGDGIGGGGGNNGVWSATVNVGVANVKTIYTLVNTDWGHNGDGRFSITAKYNNGKSLTWVYTDGQQLRDWNLYPQFATNINGTDTNEIFRVSPPLPVMNQPTPDVLDMQTLFVPQSYHLLTLETLRFTDNRQTFVHSAFLSGVTISDIAPVTASLKPILTPVPAALLLFSTSLVGLGFMVLRRRIAQDLCQ